MLAVAVVFAVLDDLYSRFMTISEADPRGAVIRKATVAGLPQQRADVFKRNLSGGNRAVGHRIDPV